MGWSRRWLIDSQAKWQRTLGALASWGIDFAKYPVELVVREEYQEKTPEQRRLFHAICSDVGTAVGLTPGETKEAIKRDYYGVERKLVAGRQYEFVQSSEDSDRDDYSQLIDFAYRWAAEAGVVVPDRRRK